MIPIAKEIARQLVPGKGVTKLLRGPRSRWMFRHGDMHDVATIMGEEHQNKQQPARGLIQRVHLRLPAAARLEPQSGRVRADKCAAWP